jgi:hypothetical protein
MNEAAMTNRYYLDSEFDEDGKTIELISLALVHESGEQLYVVSNEFGIARCTDWVKAHVLPLLPPRETWLSRAAIYRRLVHFLARGEASIEAAAAKYGKPEIWAYFADYDWVVLCQLFGRMVDLPKGMPMYCRDLKQLMDEHGIQKGDLPAPDPLRTHDALADATWNLHAHRAILEGLAIEAAHASGATAEAAELLLQAALRRRLQP